MIILVTAQICYFCTYNNITNMIYTYKTIGTCSQLIETEVIDGIIKHVKFYGGCNGNLKGISQLVIGMHADEAIKRLKGIRCGLKNTSCPDQLACALEACLINQSE